MISAQVKFQGFDAPSWTNLISLFNPGVVERVEREPTTSDAPEIAEGMADRRVGTLVVIVDDHQRVLKAFHTVHGRVKNLSYDGTDNMPELCAGFGASRCVVIREGVMDEIAERLAMRLQRGDDYVTQWLVLGKIFREIQDAGLLRLWPRPLANVPVPSPGTVRRALDLVLPDERSMVAVLWDGPSLWTTFAVRRRAGAIDLVAGPDLISRWTGPLGGDWRRDHRVVVDAVSRHVAPVHLGVFSEVDTMRALLRQADAGAWARAVAVRDVILHPAPPYAAVALGADAVRGVARVTAGLLGGLDFADALAPITTIVRSRVAEVTSISATLGFNPLTALSAMLRRDDPAPEGELDESEL